MVSRLNNSAVSQALIEKAKINIATDSVANQIAEKIIPVLDCEPRKQIKILRASATATLLTTSATKRTFLIGFNAANVSVNQSAIVNDYVSFTNLDGAINYFFELPNASGAADENINSMSQMFLEGIEVKKNTAINFTKASSGVSAAIFYYEID